MKKILYTALVLLAISTVSFAAETINVSHIKGNITIALNPQRIVLLDYGTLDTLDSFGVASKLALPKGNLPSYLAKFRAEEYTDVGGLREFNLETINAFKPDFIVISNRQQEYYQELSSIAPVYVVDVLAKDQISETKKNIRLMGSIFDCTQKAQDAIKDIEKAIIDTKEKAEKSAKKALVVLTNDGKIGAYGSGTRFGIVHDGFGVIQADPNIKAGAHGQLVNYEYIARVNPDIIFVVDRSVAIGVRAKDTKVLDNALIAKTSAARNNKIVLLDPECWYLSGGGIQSLSRMIAEINNAIE